MNAEKHYYLLCNTPSDIYMHLPTIKKYAEECDVVVELGVRWVVSTWAFVVAKPKKLISVDIIHPNEFNSNEYANLQNPLDAVSTSCAEQGTDFEFILGDSRTVELPEHDLLFIDTLHKYDVLKEELKKQTAKTKKYIIFHDTTLFGTVDEGGGGPGINLAINEFLADNPCWSVKEVFTNNNGLTVLQKNTHTN
jgi:hypothetical protein